MPVLPPAGGFPVGIPPENQTSARAPALFLADAVDAVTGDYLSVLRGVDPVEARALEALRVRRGSGSAVMDDGHQLHTLEVIDDKLPVLLRAAIEFAWKRLLDDRLIELVSADVDPEGDTASVRIVFLNLVSGTDGRFSLPLQTLLPRAS